MSGWLSRACASGLVAAGVLLGSQPVGRAQWFQPPPPPEKILRQLDAPTTLEFIETPVADVVAYLRDLHGIDVRMDLKAFEKAKISPDEPITRNLRGISLRSALRLTLPDLGLTYVLQRDHLLITTPKAARGRLVAHSYPIGDLVDRGPAEGGGKVDAVALTAVITATVAPRTWWAAGGRGTIAAWPPAGPKALAVTQIGPVHDEVVELLGRIRRVAAGGRGLNVAERKIHEALAARTTLDFIQTPLQDVVDYLKDLHGIEIQLDRQRLDAVKVFSDAPVTASLKGISLENALQKILGKMKLTYLVGDEVLLVTTAEEVRKRWLVKAYRLGPEDARRVAPDATQPGAKGVVEKITTTITPKTWKQAGAGGVIAAVSLGKHDALVVRQTADVHEQIVKLLEPPAAGQPKPQKAETPKE